jgi:hypothetical protein
MTGNYSLYNTSDAAGGGAAPVKPGLAATGTHYSLPWGSDNGFLLEVITTGTLTGTWTLWTSSKQEPDRSSDTDWVDISTDPAFVETNPAGAATKWSVRAPDLKARWFRLKYVNSGGTGNIEAYVSRV